MSILGEISYDDIAPQGRPLPDGEYLVTVEAAQVKTSKKNKLSTYAWRQYSNIRRFDGSTEFPLADGSQFRIGKRKLFNNSTLTNPSDIAVQIGTSQIKKEAIAAGVVAKPVKGGAPVSFPYDTPEKINEYLTTVLIGREVPIRTRQKARLDDLGNVVKNPDTQEPEVDIEIDYIIR